MRRGELRRSICRMVPVECASVASLNNFKLLLPDLLENFLLDRENKFTWTFAFKCRNNNKFNNKIEFLDQILSQIPPNYEHVTYGGDVTFLLDITQHLMCVSVLKNYEKYKKFSFLAFSPKNDEESEKSVNNEDFGEKSENEAKNDENGQNKNLNIEREEKEDIDLF